jgi:hypothetical protein
MDPQESMSPTSISASRISETPFSRDEIGSDEQLTGDLTSKNPSPFLVPVSDSPDIGSSARTVSTLNNYPVDRNTTASVAINEVLNPVVNADPKETETSANLPPMEPLSFEHKDLTRRKFGSQSNLNTDIQAAMNITHFEKLMNTFKRAQQNEGISGFDIDTFREVFGEILGGNLSFDQMTMLFMKIDANSDGAIDWDEFSSYMMTGTFDTTDLKTVFNDKERRQIPAKNKDMIKRIDYIPKERKYLTVSRDGVVNLWNPDFVIQKSVQLRTLMNSDAWIIDACFLHEYHKLAVITDNRQLCVFDILSIKARCLLILGPFEHNPLSICFARSNDEEIDMLLTGDDAGYLNMVVFPRRFFIDTSTDSDSSIILNPISLTKKEANKGGMTYSRRKLNDEWITQVAFYPEMNSFVACSGEKVKSVTIGDVQRKTVRHISVEKGIRCFEYCRRPSFLITAGRDKVL